MSQITKHYCQATHCLGSFPLLYGWLSLTLFLIHFIKTDCIHLRHVGRNGRIIATDLVIQVICINISSALRERDQKIKLVAITKYERLAKEEQGIAK